MTAIVPPNSQTLAEESPSAPEAASPFRRRILTMGGILLAAGFVLAPVFVAKSPLRQQILPRLLPDYPAEITTGRASLMWWSPVELSNVQFRDPDGESLLSVAKITSKKSLIALLADRMRPGGFSFHQPHLTIRLRKEGSNLEETLAPLFASEDGAALDWAIHIRDGRLEILDPASERKSELRNVQADVRLPGQAAELLTVRGSAQVQKAGTLDFDLSHRRLSENKRTAKNRPPAETWTLRLQTKDLHLQALSAAFARWDPEWEMTGVLVSDLAAEWTRGGSSPSFQLEGGLNATNFSLKAPAWLGEDQVRLDYLTHQGQFEYQAGVVHLRDLALKSDLLSCKADGLLNLPQILQAWNSPTPEIPLEEFHLSGEVQLARLAKMLPRTLKLRKGLELQTGKLLVDLDAKTEKSEQNFSGNIRTSRITAVNAGREIVWDRPLEVSVKARNTPEGPVLDELVCRADFLSLWAQGTPQNATFKAACRLDELTTEIQRFSDWDAWRLAGRIDAGLTLKRLNPRLLRGAASAIVKNFRFSRPGEPPDATWAESQLVLAAGGDLVSPEDRPHRLENASVRISAGNDELKISQTEPADWTGQWPPMKVLAELRGDLRSWQSRLKPFFDTNRWQIAGDVVATAQANLAEQRILVEEAVANLQNLTIDGPGVNLREARAQLKTRGEWDRKARTIRLPTTTWASPSLSLRADDVVSVESAGDAPRTSGRAVFRGGVGELCRWLKFDSFLGPERNLAGTASGQIELTMNRRAADVDWNILLENAALRETTTIEPPPGVAFRRINDRSEIRTKTLWSEDRVTIRGGGIYRSPRDHLELKPTHLEAPWLSITAKGRVKELKTRGLADLTGSLACNWPVLAERHRETLGANFQIVGRETRPFTIRGPLWGAAPDQRIPDDLTAFTVLPWERIDVYGIPGGPAELTADLNQGILQLGPVDMALGGGRLKVDAQVNWNAQEPTLRIKKGPILENIRLKPEVSRSWIRYALPILADSTETEGQFSATLTTDGLVPLGNPSAGKASLRVAIDSAEMRPGRLGKSLLDVAKQVKSLIRGEAAGGVLPADQALLRLEKQDVEVQLAEGRVSHQNLKLRLGEIPLTTSGSVGFDETLALTAEIPVQADWLTDNRLLAGLRGQTLKIPIRGTLSQPRLDTRAVFQALRQAAQNATGRLLGEELQNQFDRLLD